MLHFSAPQPGHELFPTLPPSPHHTPCASPSASKASWDLTCLSLHPQAQPLPVQSSHQRQVESIRNQAGKINSIKHRCHLQEGVKAKLPKGELVAGAEVAANTDS